MVIVRTALAPIFAISFAAPLAAKDKPPVFVETAAVKDKPAIVLNPAKAYVLLRADIALPLYLMKQPTAEDQATYDKLRADALVEAHGKYVKKRASYEQAKITAVKTPGTRVPEEPVEPTEANFEFVPFGMMASVGIGPMNRFAKTKDASTYVQELTPGTYRIYGLVSALPGVAPMGSCFCMGSVEFGAKAGEIVDLGLIQALGAAERVPGDSSAPLNNTSQKYFIPAGDDMPPDPRLSGAKLVPATFKPVGKLPNYFGLTITRLPEMPGVMRYDRDRIVDLTAQ